MVTSVSAIAINPLTGNLYQLDYPRNLVIVTTPSGQFVTKWGGNPSLSTSAGTFNSPMGIAISNGGIVYVADTGDDQIQYFSATGQYLGGWGESGSQNGNFTSVQGIAVNSSGNVFASDAYARVQIFTSTGSYLGNLTGFTFSQPTAIAINSTDYVYVLDASLDKVVVFSPSGTYIRNWGVFGTGTGQFESPQGITINSTGEVYVADTNNNRIEVFSKVGTYIRQWGGKGTLDGQLWQPTGIAADASDHVYVGDIMNRLVKTFSSSGAFQTKWGAGMPGNFFWPLGIAVNQTGYIYVADSSNHRIQVLYPNGTFLMKWGTYGAENGNFSGPRGIAINSTGCVYVVDTGNSRVQIFNQTGQYISQFGLPGSGAGDFTDPFGIALNSSGCVYVTDSDSNTYCRVQIFNMKGNYIGTFGQRGSEPGNFTDVGTLAIDSNNNVYVVEGWTNGRVEVFSPTGTFINQWIGPGNGTTFNYPIYSQKDCNPTEIAVNGTSMVYVTDNLNDLEYNFATSAMSTTINSRVLTYSTSGSYETTWGSSGEQDGQFNEVRAIAINGSGGVFVTDDARVQIFQENIYVPPPIFAPNAPHIASVTVSLTGNVTLKWDAVTGASTYTVYRYSGFIAGLNGSVPSAGAATTTEFSDKVNASGTYYYVVTASNSSGTSGISNCVSADVTLGGIPGPSAGWITLAALAGVVIVIWRRKNFTH
ncbi:MAG TPA: 6-bladed beta-propeller [Candidatus Lokiarchaeia archaeon]|nr:6-bladed beta-propeller [Candidatus Lokiarchaeia archaeon]